MVTVWINGVTLDRVDLRTLESSTVAAVLRAVDPQEKNIPRDLIISKWEYAPGGDRPVQLEDQLEADSILEIELQSDE